MGISSVSAAGLPNASGTPQGAGADAKIRSLEQKLQQLNTERGKAVQRKDEKEKQKLEKQIEEIKKQIEQLKQQPRKSEAVTASDAPAPQAAVPEPSGVGKYIDVYG